jgi:hypothetical protein
MDALSSEPPPLSFEPPPPDELSSEPESESPEDDELSEDDELFEELLEQESIRPKANTRIVGKKSNFSLFI